jgi:cephalosporin hydroxylase
MPVVTNTRTPLKQRLSGLLRYIFCLVSHKLIINNFHYLYYNNDRNTWRNTFWMGVLTKKCPLDLWIYQEIIFDLKPDVIIESGTSDGGSALFLASMCDLLGKGMVVTIDVMVLDDRKEELGSRYRPQHDRIVYLHGSSTSSAIVHEVEKHIKASDTVLVILDSHHVKEHVLKEIHLYHKFVTPGSYLIVEDTNLNGHPVLPEYGPGPMEALEQFLQENKEFEVDKEKQKFMLTFNPRGYLKKL